MVIVDTLLAQREAEGNPIRVGLIGAGFAARGFALQLLTIPQGMRLVAIANRTPSYSKQAFTEALGENVEVTEVSTQGELEDAIRAKKLVTTTDYTLVTGSEQVDVIVEATGEIDFGSKVIFDAIQHKKHVVLLNAELDATLGAILQDYARKAGVVYTQADGDQPGKLMNLSREVESYGFKTVLAGNIKSLIDARRTPDTQAAFAASHFQRPKMITSFADGTKISMEQATIANGLGFSVGKRGMYGPKCTHVDQAINVFDHEELLRGGIVDYILGAEPSFGVFVLAHSDHPIRQRYMEMYKLGKGPFYTFYIPFHLAPLEAPMSVARAVLCGDVTLSPKNGLTTEVITLAKKDLKAGERLDGIGGFTCYGTLEKRSVAKAENLLPMGLSDNCVLTRDIKMDEAISYDDVTLPPGRLCDKLREEQNALFE